MIVSIAMSILLLYAELLYSRCSIIGPQLLEVESLLQSCSDDNYTMPENLELNANICSKKDGLYANITNDVLSLTDLTVGSSICAQIILGQDIISNTIEVAGQLYGNAYNDLNDYNILTKNRCIAGGVSTEYVITPTYLAANFASNIAISGNGDIIAVKNVCVTPPRVEMYRRESTPSGTTYTLLQEIFAPGIGCSDLDFGQPFANTLALSADGSILFIGSFLDTPTRISIYVYDSILALWTFAQTITSTEQFFGSHLACSLNGEYFVSFARGHAYVFKRIPADSCSDMRLTNSWALQQDLIPTTTKTISSLYGYVSISPDSNYIAVSDRNTSDPSVYLFKRTGNVWNSTQELSVPSGSFFGTTMSLSNNGEYIIVTDNPGTEYFFIKTSDDQWQLAQVSNFINTNTKITQSADGSLVAISSSGTSPVVLVVRRDNAWFKTQTLNIQCNIPALSADGSTLALPFLTSRKVTILNTSCNAVQQQLVVTGSVCMEKSITVTGRLSIGGSLYAGGSIAAGVTSSCSICPSDRRIKTMIQDIDPALSLALIQKLKPVKFAWKYPECHPELGTMPAGFIAQELPAALAHWRTNYNTFGTERTEGDTLAAIAMRSDSITHLIAAIIALDTAHTRIENKLLQP